MGGWAKFFELLVGEDVDGNEMDLSVAVLAGLGGTHFNNLARTALDDDVPRSWLVLRLGGKAICSKR